MSAVTARTEQLSREGVKRTKQEMPPYVLGSYTTLLRRRIARESLLPPRIYVLYVVLHCIVVVGFPQMLKTSEKSMA